MRRITICGLALAWAMAASPAAMAQDAYAAAKYAAYDAYLTQMGLGVSRSSLPEIYRELLDAYFPGASLAQWSFGASNRQPANNATTDCTVTYFNNTSYVSSLASGTIAGQSNHMWLLHELRHFEQCFDVGGREAFAQLWYRDLGPAAFGALLNAQGIGQLHDAMLMEHDAEQRAIGVWAALQECCIQPTSGRLVRPMQVTPIALLGQPQWGMALEAEVGASEGAAPYAFVWERRLPGSTNFTPLSADPADPSRVSMPITQAGTHTLRVRVRQDAVESQPDGDPDWNVHEEMLQFEVIQPGVTGLTLNPPAVAGGESSEGSVMVERLPANQTVSVSLSSSDGVAATVPASVSVTAGPYGTGIAHFPITTAGNLFAGRSVDIVASYSGTQATAALSVGGHGGDRVERETLGPVLIEVDRSEHLIGERPPPRRTEGPLPPPPELDATRRPELPARKQTDPARAVENDPTPMERPLRADPTRALESEAKPTAQSPRTEPALAPERALSPDPALPPRGPTQR